MELYEPERMSRARRRGESISFKQSVELAARLRGMRLDRALRYLDGVIAERQPVRFTRFTDGAGHKRGCGPGKYPVKTAAAFLQLLNQAKANAETKGLGSPLRIAAIVANDGNGQMKHGRQRGRQAKRTHIEAILAETEESVRPAAPKKAEKQAPAAAAVAKTAGAATESAAPKEKPQEATPAKEAAKEAPPQESPKKTAAAPAEEKAAAETAKQAPAASMKKGEEEHEAAAPTEQPPSAPETADDKKAETRSSTDEQKDVTKDGN